METILNFSRYKKSKQDIADAITDKGVSCSVSESL